MPQSPVASGGSGPGAADATRNIEPSILTALPHYLPLVVFPLILLGALYGGWWLLPPLVFMSLAGYLDRALGRDGQNMDPSNTPEHRLFWHNLPVWSWSFLWPPTLIFGMWQILAADQFSIWEDVLLAIILTMEAQAVFVVGHEMIHRRTTWERRVGEFLLASVSYPQYATEHVYIHHALVGTPYDVGSAPKGESFWKYFPKEVAITSSVPGKSQENASQGAACPCGITTIRSGATSSASRSGADWSTGWAVSGPFRYSSSSASHASFR